MGMFLVTIAAVSTWPDMHCMLLYVSHHLSVFPNAHASAYARAVPCVFIATRITCAEELKPERRIWS
jgi:hypothetical protein